jgi:endonuclease/exonuclease/phosphatase family metal-dependent hydrolase
MSNYKIVSSLRRSLPIQGGFSKLVDLDRCYNISRVSTANGKELVLINVHLSAYTTDPTIADQQLAMLYADMQAEYDKGNYVICGGDFNKDLLGDSASIFGISGSDYSWAQSFPFNYLPDGFTLVAPYDESNPIPSCRNADIPWDPETTFQITVDGFIISNNVECIDSNVVDLQFENSDHNPVYMNFKLIK